MKAIKTVFIFLFVSIFLLLLTSCSTWERRKPLEIKAYNQEINMAEIENVNLIFEEVIPGKPLNETVWDNKNGPFWDLKESKQIGFTQDYSEFIPVAATAGVIGGAIGGAVAGVTAGPGLVKTRIYIPFGNVFTKTVESAIKANAGQYSVCYQPECGSQMIGNNILKIKINEFYVWEGPLNHLNLVVKGHSELSKNGTVVSEYSFEESMLSKKLGSILSTHASFIKEMSRLTNELAQNVSTEIISNTIK